MTNPIRKRLEEIVFKYAPVSPESSYARPWNEMITQLESLIEEYVQAKCREAVIEALNSLLEFHTHDFRPFIEGRLNQELAKLNNGGTQHGNSHTES